MLNATQTYSITDKDDKKTELEKALRAYKQRLQDTDKITHNQAIIPVNIGNMNWILLYFTNLSDNAPQIHYFDPLLSNRGCDPIFNQEINKRVEAAIKSVFTKEAQITNYKAQIQTENYLCGPWVVELAKIIVKTINLPNYNIVSSININDAADEHTAILQGMEQQKSCDNNAAPKDPCKLESKPSGYVPKSGHDDTTTSYYTP